MSLIDLTFVPLLEALAPKLPTIERYVVLTDAAHMPATKLKNAVAYEEWIGEVDGDFRWAEFDENTAAGLCYTSGTTGNPKGVLYSHRSNVLHSLISAGLDCLPARRELDGAAGRADVPRQCLGPRLLRADARREAGDAGRRARRRLGLRAARNREGRLHRRRADRLADAARLHAEGRQEALLAQARGDRRLGLPAVDDPRLRGGLRRRGAPRLGHDRDEPARHGRHRSSRCRRARPPTSVLALQGQAGPCAVRRRDEDRRRRGQRAAVGRQALRPAQGRAARRSPKPITRTRAAASSTTAASSTPATSPPSIPTATCRSPTAPRT